MTRETRTATASAAPPTATTGDPIDPDDVTVAYLGGGSRQWVPNLVQDLALSRFDGEVRLYDVDVESASRMPQ